MRQIKIALALTTIATLVACGGGGGGGGSSPSASSSISLSGVAATGAAIQSGTVSVKCTTGTGTTTTNADGTYSVTVDNGTLPCILKASDPLTKAEYYSIAESGATKANITPLTHLIAANTLGDSPATAFDNFDSSRQTKISSANIATALSNIQSATAALGSDADMTGIDLLKGSFTPAIGSTSGDATDQKIDALMTALAAANKRIGDLETQLKSATSTSEASNNLLSTVGNAKNKLANCPYARSSNVWVMDLFGTSPIQYAVDFQAMTLTRVSDNQSYSIAAKTDSNNNPVQCAFTSTVNGSAVEYRVAQGGNIVWVDGVDFGLAVPSQTNLNLTDAQAVGTYPTLVYIAQKNNPSIRAAFPMKLVINSDGSVDGFTCDMSKTTPDCNTATTDTTDKNTCTKLQNGSFTCTSTSGTTSVGVIYVNGSQVSLYLTLTDMISNGYHWGGIAVSTKAQEMKLPTVGTQTAAGSSWYAGVNPNSTQLVSGLTSASTVEEVSTTNNSYVTSTTGTAETISRFINVPTPGMGYSILSNGKAITLVGNGGWALAIAKADSSSLWNGWAAYIKNP